MATLLRVRNADPKRLPLAGMLLCPFVDLETPDDEGKTPYCDPTTWGDASPVHCDLRGLPPVYIQAAELDSILPHAKRLMAKAHADGVRDWDLEIFHNVPHVFTNFPTAILPSAARGLDAVAEYAATRFGHAIQAAPIRRVEVMASIY